VGDGDDERAQAAELAAGLGAALRRRARLGPRRAWIASQSAPQSAPRPAAAPARPAAARSTAPAAPAPAARSTSVPARANSPLAPALLAAEGEAQAVRARAAACADLAALRAGVAACTACGLCATRTQTVFSDGAQDARVMFVGEAPGADEDATGVPFVGRAGKLLSDIVEKGMGLSRAQVYIANVLKCRPPENRDPSPAEKLTCTPWLDRQIELVDPQVIIPLGRHAANHVLGTDLPMGRLRGRVHELGKRHVVPTYHPAYLLRSPSMKKDCWADIQLAMGLLGLRKS
jgi:uracil-DNA glycosylase family 4